MVHSPLLLNNMAQFPARNIEIGLRIKPYYRVKADFLQLYSPQLPYNMAQVLAKYVHTESETLPIL